MGLMIEDGKGTGKLAAVDSENRLSVKAVTEDEFLSAIEDGDGYSWTNATYDYAAADTILLVRNDSSNMNLIIREFAMSSDTATYATVHCPTATFVGAGTVVTGVNLNRVSGKVAPASAWSNETGNVQGAVIRRPSLAVANTDYEVHFAEGGVVLGNGQSIGVDYITNGAACRATIYGYFEEVN